jgi:hypothetical protein
MNILAKCGAWRLRCAPGCALCGELVATPHYCVAHYEKAHAKFVFGNARYRAAMARNAESAPPECDEVQHREGLLDLCVWGDCVALGVPTPRRITRALDSLTPLQRRDLHLLYVAQSDVERARKRRGRGRRGGEYAPLTPSERAYLSACGGVR